MRPKKPTSSEKDKRAIESLRLAVMQMMRMSDLIIAEGGPEEICALIKKSGQRVIESTKHYQEDDK